MRIAVQRTGGMERPIGIEQGLPPDGDQVGVAGLQHGFGLRAIEDQSDGHGGHVGAMFHGGRERDLKAGVAGNRGGGRGAGNAAGGAVDHIDTALLQRLRQHDRIFQIPAVGPVHGGDAEKQRLALRPHRTHGLGRFQGKAHAAVAVAAIDVVAGVADRGEEARHQVAVRPMHLHGIVAGCVGAGGSVAEGADDVLNFLDRELVRDQPAGADGLGGRRDRLPKVGALGQVVRIERAAAVHRPLHRAFASAMGELDADAAALVVHHADQPAMRLDLAVVPDAHVVVGDQAALFNGGGLGEHQGEAAIGHLAEMHNMGVAGNAMTGAVDIHR